MKTDQIYAVLRTYTFSRNVRSIFNFFKKMLFSEKIFYFDICRFLQSFRLVFMKYSVFFMKNYKFEKNS